MSVDGWWKRELMSRRRTRVNQGGRKKIHFIECFCVVVVGGILAARVTLCSLYGKHPTENAEPNLNMPPSRLG